jgi:hypothetical protein
MIDHQVHYLFQPFVIMIFNVFPPFSQNGNFSLKELFVANGILVFVVGVFSKCYILVTKTEWKSESLEFVLVKVDTGTSYNAAGIKTAEPHLTIISVEAIIILWFV